MNDPQKTIAIVGGGITGLAAAHAAQILLPDFKIMLLESSERLGGVLQTENVDGYLIEKSADMFTTDPPIAMELCRQLGKQDEIIQTTPTTDRAFVATADAIHPVPRGFSLMSPGDIDAVLGSPLLDAAAKQRFLDEKNIESRDWSEDESLESFAVRRFGQSAFDNLIQPLVSGIYTADPKKLSMKATMARFVDMELGHGSLIRAAAESKQGSTDQETSGARYGLFRAPQQGIGQLVNWLEDALTRVEIRTDCPVHSVVKAGSRWTIEAQPNNSEPESISVDAILLAAPARICAHVIQSVDALLAEKLATIEAASAGIVVLGADQSQFRENFAGYGIIVPTVLNRKVIATSFSSNKFAGRAPEGKILIRCFVGGALQSELVELSDKQLINIAIDELNKTVGFSGTPALTRVYRWRNCMPQYHIGHLDRVHQIDSQVAMHPGLELAGNSYRGVGIPACIQSGQQAVERLVEVLLTDKPFRV